MFVVVRHGDVEDGFVAGGFAFLRQIAEPRAADERDLARVRRFLAEDDLEQRGFARAVRPDQPDALAGLERERNVVKQTDDRQRLCLIRQRSTFLVFVAATRQSAANFFGQMAALCRDAATEDYDLPSEGGNRKVRACQERIRQ